MKLAAINLTGYKLVLMKTLSVIIPFYNEERTIGKLVHELSSLPLGVVTEFVFVDDGSADNSLEILKEELKKVNLKNTILEKPNGGKASAIEMASEVIHTTHVVILDADLELDTFDILRLWNVVLEGKSDVVFGFRSFHAQSAFTYRYARGNQFLSHLYGILYNEVITDIMCGLKLVPSVILSELSYKYGKFAIEIEIPLELWLRRIRPYEINVSYSPRSREEGKLIGVRDAVQVIADLIFFRFRYPRKRTK
jgi:glycosyltransferase involved in cell wall biosynthesis